MQLLFDNAFEAMLLEDALERCHPFDRPGVLVDSAFEAVLFDDGCDMCECECDI